MENEARYAERLRRFRRRCSFPKSFAVLFIMRTLGPDGLAAVWFIRRVRAVGDGVALGFRFLRSLSNGSPVGRTSAFADAVSTATGAENDVPFLRGDTFPGGRSVKQS